jgi:hypothetical protein
VIYTSREARYNVYAHYSSVYARTIYKAAGMLTYLVVGDNAKSHGGNVKRISDKVDDIPHVMRVLLKAHVPQLLNFTPYQTCGILSK